MSTVDAVTHSTGAIQPDAVPDAISDFHGTAETVS